MPSEQDHVHNEATGMDPYLVVLAQEAAARELSLPFKTAVRNYYPGMFWSCMLSLALVMEGYDVGMINSFFGHTAFKENFGVLNKDGVKEVPANWQSALGNVSNVGVVFGLLINGYCQHRFGSKKVYLATMVIMVGAIFLPVFATGLPMLTAGVFICGIPWGVFQTLTTAYAAEICPLPLRAHLTSFVNICWAMGLFISSGVVRATLQINSEWGWRLPYVLQWIWPVPLFICCLFAPESPWYLSREGRTEEAKRALRKTARTGYYTDEELDAQVALMQHTHALERQENANSSIMNCFRGTNLRRTEICCVVWLIQQSCGQPLTSYATEFLEEVGMSTDQAFDLNISSNGMLVFGTILTWIFMEKVGRRPIYLWGQVIMAFVLLAMGILGCFRSQNSTSYGVGALLVLINFTFACTLGPSCYTIVGELPASEVRGPTVVLARGVYVIGGIITGQLTPRMVTAGEWNWGAKGAFLYLGTNLLGLVYCYFRLPETKGRSFGQLDVLFHNHVPARKFSSTVVEQFEQVAQDPKDKAEE